MSDSIAEDTLGWDDARMARLWANAGVPVRRILKHLYCYPDREQTDLAVAEYVEVTPCTLHEIVDELALTCEQRYNRGLPFLRRQEGGSEAYLMPGRVTRMVHVVY